MKRLVDWIVYALSRAFFAKMGLLPRPLAIWICRGLASFVFWIDAKHRRIGMINLSIAFPDKSDAWKRDVLRRSFQQLGDLAVEISRLRRLTPEEAERRVRYEPGRGLENYLRAKQAGSGVVFITAHISVWELLPLAHALLGQPLSFVVRPLDNPYLENWISGLRNQFGNKVIAKHQALRSMLKVIREGKDVGILIDQNVQPREAVFAPLFGKPAATTAAPAALALKTGAPVVMGFIYPGEKPGDYVIRFYPAISVKPSDDRERDLTEATALFNRRIEAVIREFPHCWLWGHRRFAAQPEGCENPYGDA